ncbi:ATP-binding protein [Tamlana sp. 2201CG12-4]|uniref:hybrid sensor histidine kinase/response regulator transcription factor n=1 Tax=Tamlana sp. 2201CG12-4 TaxID=3112582 RepID=UPI002DB85F00|nr:ATP-binding protein [Tamlana sp. 2201CG12-4]MEC3908875.1 ATP-binding protein [Tamlana sp. 2201CG12-4]
MYSSIQSFGQNDINFKHITPRHNNRSVFVFNTAQDSLGNIWMTTAKGILKFNGYSYHLINNREIFPEIADRDGVDDIYADNYKNIWIKSEQGLLCKYDSKRGKFLNYSNFFKEPVSVVKSKGKEIWIVTKTGNVHKLENDKAELITVIPNLNGIGTEVQGLEFGNNQEIYISTSRGKVYNYSINTKRLNELVGPFTDYPEPIVLQADNDNRLWIGTETFGLLIYDINKGEFVEDIFFKESLSDVKKELFTSLFLDSDDNVWGGTDGDGLYKINSKNGEIRVYQKNNYNEFSLSSNTIIDITEDNHKNIWIVTKYGVLDVIPKINKNVNYHKGSSNNLPLRILSIYKSKSGVLWVGTDGSGLTMIKENEHFAKQYFNDVNNGLYVQSITEDNNNNIWFGTYKRGLWVYNQLDKRFKNIDVINNKNQKATDVRTVFKDSKGRIWVGSNVAINIYSPEKKEIINSFSYGKKGLGGNILESIIEDGNNNIWLGVSNGGLYRFNENLDNIKNSSFVRVNSHDKTIFSIISMSLGKQNEIWAINRKGNLILFNTKSEKNIDFNNLSPLKNTNLKAVIAVDSLNIWMSSVNGIYHLDRKNNLVKSFYTTDGFQSNFFISRSAFKDNDGMLYFGTDEGVNFFSPKKLTKEKSRTKLFINDIEVLNKPAKGLLSNQITSDVFNLDELHLENNQSSFSVKFSAIDNILNPNYHYYYRLNGFDKDWKTTFSEGLATYTNVPPGKYTLEMKANEMNEPSLTFKRFLNITIAQPFWNKPIAHLLYLILLVLLVYGSVRWYSLRKKLLINKISRRKENELHKAKMSFFTKMSHEIQTPITLILSPIEDMLERADFNGNMLLKERLKIISSNANRLSRIARELTLIRNKELNKIKLSVAQNNLYEDVTKVYFSFKELARRKKIDFSMNCPKNLVDAWYDREKLEHVLYNLLSNAFKFTPSEGNVQINVVPVSEKRAVNITVSDSGPGIKKEELKDIFRIFYRSKSNKEVKGTGIGLALTKELVDLHNGKIKVNSISGKGTTFTVKLPIAEENYKDFERIISSKKNKPISTDEKELIMTKPLAGFDNNRKTILIVEDNFELQHFLKSLLQERYNILLAENGQEGFYHAKNNIPDLILSDIMMPIMDGVEMCKKLNDNSLTKHIPVVLLTAKNSTIAKIEGLKMGAIEFINKPFNTNELLLKINNILASKEKIISKYRKELINKPEVKINKTQDEVFLEKLTSYVNERLKDSSFKVEEIAENVNMSYSSLYRKCLAVTGLNLIDFVRILRLKKAAVLLAKYRYPISDVAYMVGFNNAKYFSKSFKKEFKISPKEFKNNAVSYESVEVFLNEYNIDILNFESETP